MESITRKLSVLLLMLLLPGVSTTHAYAESILIANETVKTTSLSQSAVQDIFLGKQKLWSDGPKVVLAVLKKGDHHRAFLLEILVMNQRQFSNHWRKVVFTGTGSMPQSFVGGESLVGFVKRTPGAIGYIDSRTPHAGCKEISLGR